MVRWRRVAARAAPRRLFFFRPFAFTSSVQRVRARWRAKREKAWSPSSAFWTTRAFCCASASSPAAAGHFILSIDARWLTCNAAAASFEQQARHYEHAGDISQYFRAAACVHTPERHHALADAPAPSQPPTRHDKIINKLRRYRQPLSRARGSHIIITGHRVFHTAEIARLSRRTRRPSNIAPQARSLIKHDDAISADALRAARTPPCTKHNNTILPLRRHTLR